MNTATEILGWVITLGYIVWMAATLSNLRRRLTKLEGKGSTGLGVKTMDAVDDVTAMVVGLRNQLVNQGFSPEAAEQITVEVLRSAANQASKK